MPVIIKRNGYEIKISDKELQTMVDKKEANKIKREEEAE